MSQHDSEDGMFLHENVLVRQLRMTWSDCPLLICSKTSLEQQDFFSSIGKVWRARQDTRVA